MARIEDELRAIPPYLLPVGRGFLAISVSNGVVTVAIAKMSSHRRLEVTVHQNDAGRSAVDTFLERRAFHDEPVGPFRENRLIGFVDAASDVLSPVVAAIQSEQFSGITISAPGYLSHIPYEALWKAGPQSSVLVDSMEISYLPSLLLGERILERAAAVANEELRLLVIPYNGEDLPESANEVQMLHRLWGRNMTLLAKADCVKTTVLAELAKPYSHVHFVCHGTFNSAFPQRSALLLQGDSVDDRYIIPASEILQLTMPAAPVVSLSACSSGASGYPPSNPAPDQSLQNHHTRF